MATSTTLFALRLLSPSVLVLATLTLFGAQKRVDVDQPSRSDAPSESSALIATRTQIPRRSLITYLLALTSLTYLAEGLIFVILAVVHKIWPSKSGIEISAFIGIFAFCDLAILGGWKAVNGVDIWSTKRVKGGVGLSLLLDLAQGTLGGVEFIDHNSRT